MRNKRERPILFSTPMVRALLEGSKTQTRRIIKPQPKANPGQPEHLMLTDKKGGDLAHMWEPWHIGHPRSGYRHLSGFCPYGQPGDRLYVKETFFAWGRWVTRFNEKKKRDEWHFLDITIDCGEGYLYQADGVSDTQVFTKRRTDTTPMYWKRPNIFMPKHASRITLEITDVRVEQLQDISDEDAIAEGMFFTDYGKNCFHGGRLTDVGNCPAPDEHHPQRNGWSWKETSSSDQCLGSARLAFANLWGSINGPDSWDANPWVWVIEFRRVDDAQ